VTSPIIVIIVEKLLEISAGVMIRSSGGEGLREESLCLVVNQNGHKSNQVSI
jgi:hypothetical protein